MSAPAFDDVDAFEGAGQSETFEGAGQPEGGGATDVSNGPPPGTPVYRIDGYSVEGYRLEGRALAPRLRTPPTRRPRAPRSRPEPRPLGAGDESNLRAPRARPRRQPTPRPQRRSVPPEDGDDQGYGAYPQDYPPDGPRAVRPRRRRLRLRRKAVPLRPHERPYARLGLLWLVLLLVALVIGPAALAVLAAPVGLIAAASALRAARTVADPEGEEPDAARPADDEQGAVSRDEGPKPDTTKPLHGVAPPDPLRPHRPEMVFFGRRTSPSDVRAALLGAVVLAPFAALGGPFAALAGGVVVVGAAASAGRALGCSPLGAGLAVAAPISAMCALVVARGQGFAVGLVLVVALCCYDAAACLMGNRPTGGFLGVVSGLLTLGVLAFLVSALADPPFGGNRAWVMCLMAGVLAWVGVKVCRGLMRGGTTLPALARLDSLVVAGPVWVVVAAVVLHR